MPEAKTPEQLAQDVKDAFQKSQDQTREIAEKALSEAKSAGGVSAKTKETADEALIKMNEAMTVMNTVKEQLAVIEQNMAKAQNAGGGEQYKSIGEQFVQSEDVRAFMSSATKRGKVSLSLKATITSATADALGSAGAMVPHDRRGFIALPDRRMTVRDLLTPGTTSSNTIEYPQETGFTNNAAAVAEGSGLAQSDIKVALVSTGVKTVGHFMKASRQVLEDAEQLQSHINERLRYGLAYKEELQILNGDGTGQNLAGIIPQATAYAAPAPLAANTSIDQLRLAILQASLTEYAATGHILNPIDWAFIETLRDGENRYLIGNPQGETTPSLWRLPVVETQAIAVDKFLTGAFKMGAQLFDRRQSTIEIATENSDDFEKNLLTIKCDERLALAVYRPQAFIYGDFGRVA